MGMIEDNELRELFKIESQEHIQGLEKGLLRLESDPSDKAVLEEVFREAHSLKGSARMVGVRDVEIISHRIEDILGAVRKGTASVTSELVDNICRALDGIKGLVSEAVTGLPSGVEVGGIIELLDEGGPQKKTPDAQTGVAEDSAAHSAEFRIDTVRVDTSRLDELAALTGELAVFRTRLHARLDGIDEATEAIAWILKGTLKGTAGQHNAAERIKGLVKALSKLKEAAYEDTSRFDLMATGLDEGVKQLRLLPFSTLFNLFPRVVRDMAREAGKDVTLIVEGGETGADKRIIEEMKDPLMHILRNAVIHGIEDPAEREASGKPRTGTITLRAHRTEASIIVEVADNGRGLDLETIKNAALKRRLVTEDALTGMDEAGIKRLIFVSGLSTSSFVTETSGRGVGLDVVRANVEKLKGSIEAESGAGCTFKVRLPATLATARMLIVEDFGRRYALPMDQIHTSIRVRPEDIFLIEGRQAINHDGVCVSVARLSQILELPDEEKARAGAKEKNEASPCVIISSGADRLAVIVDELLDEQEVVLKQGGGLLKRVRNVSGTTILGSGEVCIILNPSDMIKTVHKRHAQAVSKPEAAKDNEGKKTVLLVEDSITTRTQEKRILVGAGYEVVMAVDGLDAISLISTQRFDAVVSDIMMPNMDGLALTARLRQDARYKDIPIVLVTTLASDEDKKRGLEAGANAYIPKPSFDQKIFLDTLSRLL
ncbi:MAG: hybrid sensor histidine kinase/response regulator [Deltaproteobacteria bacterium]